MHQRFPDHALQRLQIPWPLLHEAPIDHGPLIALVGGDVEERVALEHGRRWFDPLGLQHGLDVRERLSSKHIHCNVRDVGIQRMKNLIYSKPFGTG